MLVFGDHRENVHSAERLQALSDSLAQVARMPPGIERHGKLVGALVEAGQLLQGIADQGAPAPVLDQFVFRLAACVVRSWDSRFADLGDLPAVPRTIELPTFEVRVPEGFAFYAVYPEAYIEAARRLSLSAPPRIIGIRSIGTTLGAVVAATLGASPAITVRPFGDPFSRQVELPDDAIDSAVHYVIVDEGPGLSGSSFGAVADELERKGVARNRIAFLPSHDGDLGPRASDAHRERWKGAQRVAASFDPAWLSDVFEAIEEIDGNDPLAQLKFHASGSDGRMLVRFFGLGAIGERKLEMARTLHAAGLSLEPLGFVHGFLLERWREDAEPLREGEKPLNEIGHYLSERARLFPADSDSGASIGKLVAMCRRNISLTLGETALEALSRFDTDRLQCRVRRIKTDNKLDRQEWLRLPDGRLLKTDAVDHHRAHDLIGCQDICWDVAGAIIEFDLTSGERSRLVALTGLDLDSELIDFCLIAYASFRLGRAIVAGADIETERYRKALQLLLQLGVPENRLESALG